MRHTPNEIWLEILEKLSDTARQDVYLHQAVPLSITAEALNIAVPSAYTRARIEERFRADIQRVLATLIGAQCALILTVDEPPSEDSEDFGETQNTENLNQLPNSRQASDTHASVPSTQNETGLNPTYRFDRFHCGFQQYDLSRYSRSRFGKSRT